MIWIPSNGAGIISFSAPLEPGRRYVVVFSRGDETTQGTLNFGEVFTFSDGSPNRSISFAKADGSALSADFATATFLRHEFMAAGPLFAVYSTGFNASKPQCVGIELRPAL